MNTSEYVNNIIEDIRKRGIDALKFYSEKFDKYSGDFKVNEDEFDEAERLIPYEDIKVIEKTYERIYDNHKKQIYPDIFSFKNSSMYGIIYKPIKRIGEYIPGSKPLPSTVMMITAPAKIAGVGEIVLTSAPVQNKLNPYVLYIAKFLGISEVYKIGGIQAIAAMAYGIGMKNVDKIFGPGNIYVNEAKRQVYGIVGIDGLYGPSEICVLADSDANPEYILSDLRSQLEHGETSKSWIVTTNKKTGEYVNDRKIEVKIFESMEQCIDCVNDLAPEHLEIMVKEPMGVVEKIENAGAIYIGDYTPVPSCDYFTGVNHLLPTGRTAKFSSALTVTDFMKKTSFAYNSREDFMENRYLGMRLAEIENMNFHKQSMEVRK